LELRQRSGPRTGGEVSIAVQTDSGQRTTGKFPSSDTLHHVIASTIGIPAIGKGQELVCVFTRREIIGETALRTTTLRELGLTSGSAVLRVTARDVGVGHVQAHVEDLKLKKGPVAGPSKTEEVVADVKQNVSKFGKSLKKMMSGVFEGSSDSKKGSKDEGHRLGGAAPSDIVSPILSQPKARQQTAPNHNYTVNSEVVWLGDRDALLFKLEDMQKMSTSPTKESADLPDEFFEVTRDDVILMYQDLKTRIVDMESRPLETKELRDRRKMTTAYSKTVLRISFLSEGLFLQGIFSPQEKVAAVEEWLKTFLEDPSTDFYLFTTPPKEVLKREWTLVEKKLVPAAVIQFGQNGIPAPTVLKKEYYEKITSFDAISAETKKLRDAVTKTRVAVPNPVTETEVPFSSVERTSSSGASRTDSTSKSSDQKVPKWFKPGK
jgi:tether containing UBX domain for GLUT4